MNESDINALTAWLAKAGLSGEPEDSLVSGFCDRAVAAGLPIGRAQVFIDTLHPVYEGRLVRWGYAPSRPVVQEYGRTGSATDASAGDIARWRASPFFYMLQSGENMLHCRVTEKSEPDFPVFKDYRTDGMTDYIAIINRFAPENTIGEMDCIYSSWLTSRPEGFTDAHVAALKRVVPTLALAFKAAALARMTGTLMETYLGRDAGRRVLSGRIMRGVTERIDAAIWFSDLRGFTRITDTSPEQIITLLNDYADVVVSAIHAQGGDVLKLSVTAFLQSLRRKIVHMPVRLRLPQLWKRARRCKRSARAAHATWFRPRTCMSVCMWAKCSTAISEAPNGSISPWSVRPSMKRAASRLCAARSTSRCWSRRHSPTSMGCAAISYRLASMPSVGWRSRKNFSHWIPAAPISRSPVTCP